MKVNPSVTPPFLLRPESDCVWLRAPNERELFAYWRLSERTMRLAELHTGVPWTALPRLLRVYEIGVLEKAGATLETAIEPQGALYVQGIRGGAVYIADIGYRSEEGAFVSLCRSEPAEAPGVGQAAACIPGTGLPFIRFRDERFSLYTLYMTDRPEGGVRHEP